MLLALPIGILVGIILALAPGPVAIGAMKLGINKGKRQGTLYSIGSGMMDFFYCAFAIFATSAVLAAVGDFASDHPFVILTVQISIVLGIIAYGIYQFKYIKKKQIDNQIEPLEAKKSFIEHLKSRGPFFIGVAVSLTNIASPTFLPSLGAVTVYVQKMGFFEAGVLNSFLLSLGFGLGNFLWLYFIVRVITHYKNKFNERFIALMYKFAGFTLIGFGTYLGYSVISITKWSEIIKIAFAFRF